MKKYVIDNSSGKGSMVRVILLTMKLLTILIFAATMTVSASVYSQKTKIDLQLQNSTVGTILKSIESRSEFIFFYDVDLINARVEKSISVRDANISTVLEELFGNSNIAYFVDDRQIFLYKKDDINQLENLKEKSRIEVEQPQKKELSGMVKDSKGLPLPGVTVVVKGTTVGTISDNDGNFRLSVPVDAKTIVFSFVGLKTQEVAITGKTSVKIVMEELTVGLDEVVAVGYGSQKKATMTGAVSLLKGESLLTSPVSNITNSLQGKVTGVTSIQQNGQPGLQNADIFIRGRATTGDATAIVIVDGIERSEFGSMDPNEIESITVLKDASSTAIFGIRGANGVLVITTKHGKEGKPTVRYSGNVTGNFYIDFPERLNAYETAKLQNVGAHNNGKSTGWNYYWTDEELQHFKNHDLPYQYPDVDWMSTVARKFNMQTQHNLSVQGGTKSVKYYISGGYMHTDGILKKFPSDLGIKTTDSYSKYNFRSNLDFDITKNLRVSLKAAGTMENIYQPQPTSNLGSFFYSVLNISTDRSPVYTQSGHFATSIYCPGHQPGNPVAVITHTGYLDGQKNKLEANLDIDLKLNWLTQGLSFKTLLSYDNAMNSYLQQTAAYSEYYIDRITGVETKHPNYQDDTVLSALAANSNWGPSGNLSYNFQTGFDYARDFGKHNVTGLVRFTRRLTEINAAADAPYCYQGGVSRITYNYDNRYLLEGSVSYNGSENFPKGNRYGLFPSGSVGYIISNEEFFKKNVSFMNLLKFRGSLGLVGNDKFPGGTARYLYLDEYAESSATINWTTPNTWHPGNAVYFGQPSSPAKYNVMTHSRIGNPNITWEKGLKADVGIETGFFNSKIKMTADYFYERRSDILMDPRTGFMDYGEAYPKLNKGVVENKGYEIQLDMNNKFGEFTVGLMASISHSANKIIDADDPPGIPDYQKLAGKRVGQYMGYETAGFFNSQQEVDDSNNQVAGAWPKNTMASVCPGDLKFIDYNKDGFINSKDKHPILTSNLPEYNYSFTPSISYKNFTLSVLFQGTMKSMSDFLLTFNYFGYMKDSWTPENVAAGKKIVWPALRDDWNGPSIAPAYANDFVIKPNNYLKLRNFEFSYQVPVTFARKLSLSSARLIISGQNIATWSKFKDFYHVDPEVYIGSTGGAQTTKREYAYPLARTINFGVEVQF